MRIACCSGARAFRMGRPTCRAGPGYRRSTGLRRRSRWSSRSSRWACRAALGSLLAIGAGSHPSVGAEHARDELAPTGPGASQQTQAAIVGNGLTAQAKARQPAEHLGFPLHLMRLDSIERIDRKRLGRDRTRLLGIPQEAIARRSARDDRVPSVVLRMSIPVQGLPCVPAGDVRVLARAVGTDLAAELDLLIQLFRPGLIVRLLVDTTVLRRDVGRARTAEAAIAQGGDILRLEPLFSGDLL